VSGLSVEVRRIVVAVLTDRHMSPAQIAAELGVSRETVRRDLLARPAPAEDQAATDEQPAEAPPEPEPAPDAAPDATVTVPVTGRTRANLDALAEAGFQADDAVESGLQYLADTYRGAWRAGYPRHAAPVVRQLYARYAPAT
jgi:hypothetical protein